MSSILDTQKQFYPILVRFLADESQASTLALDEAESAYEHYMSVHGRKRSKDPRIAILGRQAKAFHTAASDYIRNSNGVALSRWILELPDDLVHAIAQMVLSEAVLDDELLNHRRLRLLIVHWAAHELRIWTNRLKKNNEPPQISAP